MLNSEFIKKLSFLFHCLIKPYLCIFPYTQSLSVFLSLPFPLYILSCPSLPFPNPSLFVSLSLPFPLYPNTFSLPFPLFLFYLCLSLSFPYTPSLLNLSICLFLIIFICQSLSSFSSVPNPSLYFCLSFSSYYPIPFSLDLSLSSISPIS